MDTVHPAPGTCAYSHQILDTPISDSKFSTLLCTICNNEKSRLIPDTPLFKSVETTSSHRLLHHVTVSGIDSQLIVHYVTQSGGDSQNNLLCYSE